MRHYYTYHERHRLPMSPSPFPPPLPPKSKPGVGESVGISVGVAVGDDVGTEKEKEWRLVTDVSASNEEGRGKRKEARKEVQRKEVQLDGRK